MQKSKSSMRITVVTSGMREIWSCACGGHKHKKAVDNFQQEDAKADLVLDVAQHGQHKGERFAGACFGDADAVAAAHDCRECLRLNRHGLGEAALLQHVQHAAVQAALVPVLHRPRDVLAAHLHSQQDTLSDTCAHVLVGDGILHDRYRRPFNLHLVCKL